jgi:hypothetical protein
MLQWIRSDRPPSQLDLGWLKWIGGLFKWLGQTTRYLVWAMVIFLVAWIGVSISRGIRERRSSAATGSFVPPTHVRDLDIRPESLPPNIGKAARSLWDRGEHRAALSLLYRGLLSRLTHVHHVPITDSSTEGDCLTLATGRVSPVTGAYTARLVVAWQAFVYGGTATTPATLYGLCDEFSAALDRAAGQPAEGNPS